MLFNRFKSTVPGLLQPVAVAVVLAAYSEPFLYLFSCQTFRNSLTF